MTAECCKYNVRAHLDQESLTSAWSLYKPLAMISHILTVTVKLHVFPS